MKGSTVRGTPVRHVAVGARGEGSHAGAPPNMEGTVDARYGSEKSGYRKMPGEGTPYHSETGNPPNARREISHGERGGVVLSENGLNMNEPESSDTVLFEERGAGDYGRGYDPPGPADVMDSPVPGHAPFFDAGMIETIDKARQGKGAENQSNPDLVAIGGVMSRGMEPDTRTGQGENAAEAEDNRG